MPKPSAKELCHKTRCCCGSPDCYSTDLASRVEKALALHERMRDPMGECCRECNSDWPCPTRRALDGEEE